MNTVFRSASLLALVAATSSAMALTLVQTTTSSYSWDQNGTYGPLAFDLPIVQLSPSLGVLTAVDVSWSTTTFADVYGDSADGMSHVLGAISENTLSLGSVSLMKRNNAYAQIGLLNGVLVGGAEATGAVTGSATDLTPFVGTGAVSPASWTSELRQVGNNYVPEGGIRGNVRGTATVTYTYAPVPEPGTFAALGLGALGLLRRKRKA